MKASDQLKVVRSKMSVSQHTFLNRIAEVITQKVQGLIDMPLQMSGKAIKGDEISVNLVGQKVCTSAEELERTQGRVHDFMNDLKNPSNLLSLLK